MSPPSRPPLDDQNQSIQELPKIEQLLQNFDMTKIGGQCLGPSPAKVTDKRFFSNTDTPLTNKTRKSNSLNYNNNYTNEYHRYIDQVYTEK